MSKNVKEAFFYGCGLIIASCAFTAMWIAAINPASLCPLAKLPVWLAVSFACASLLGGMIAAHRVNLTWD